MVGPPVVIPGGSFSASIDLSKTISTYEPIAGPSCVTPGTRVVWSVNPALQCPSDGLGVDPIVWVRTNTDAAFGNPVWTSLDNPTSLTYDIPSTINTPTAINLLARVGRCPVGNPNSGFLLPTLGIFRQAGPTWLTTASNRVYNLGGNQVYVGINTVPAGSVTCNSTTIALNGSEHNGLVLPINTNPLTLPANQQQQQIVLTAQGNGPADVGDLGIKFQFSPPSNAGDGFTWIQGSSTAQNQNPQFTLTTANFLSDDFLKGQVSGLYNNATGTYSVLASSPNGCTGATGGSYRIFRYMVPPAAGVTPPLTRPNAIAPERYNYIINASGPNGTGIAPRACYRGNEAAEILILQNAPTGPFARFTWTAPNGWVLNSVAGNGASEITGAGTNSITGLNLVSVSILPVITNDPLTTAQTGKVSVTLPPPVYPNSTVNWCNVPNPVIQYPFGQGNDLIPEGTRNRVVNPGTPTGTPKVAPITVDFPIAGQTPACGYDQLEIQYQFRGQIRDQTTNALIYTTANGGTSWECNGNIFPNLTGCNPGWLNGATNSNINVAFLGGNRKYIGAYRVWVRTRAGATPCPALTCYNSGGWRCFPDGATEANNVGTNWRIATEASWSSDENQEPGTVYPNPANQEFFIVNGEEDKGTYQLVSLTGSILLEGKLENGTLKVSTKGIPKGIYLLKRSGQNPSTVKLVIQ